MGKYENALLCTTKVPQATHSAQYISMIYKGNVTYLASPRQESNLYLALRRRPFYPLNYRERGTVWNFEEK